MTSHPKRVSWLGRDHWEVVCTCGKPTIMNYPKAEFVCPCGIKWVLQNLEQWYSKKKEPKPKKAEAPPKPPEVPGGEA